MHGGRGCSGGRFSFAAELRKLDGMVGSGSPRRKSWQRFTLLDVLLLQAGVALGFSLVFLAFGPRASELAPPGLVVLVVAAVLLGMILSGPLVLSVQIVFRGRRERLSMGEWLWLSPLVLGLAAVIGGEAWAGLSASGRPGDEGHLVVLVLLILLFASVQAACMLNALMVLAAGTGPVPCVWTDRFGAASCLASGVAVLLVALGILGP